ncbi:L-glutamate gamma-semialdehyde dehydrogenase [Auraticoccus monumenti]|uniref:L-glutamate gamma-semialdehyde dehydrogenase n=1 Tax=Auraticoccus monumenti TaxID=675864 RepID=A0A1G7AFM0_9ACTN|nr:L-glutamate gamma-semialdehyde dehydrogenase [Auraticoccus monumenti]SDE13621.1 delta-1-pyrroline-5-carboxylate dehydrogenase [Auraticoccus monumenti]
MDARTSVPPPVNEPVRSYAPGSPERASLAARLEEMAAAEPVELTACIGGERRLPGGESFEVTMPSDHHHVLGRSAHATAEDAAAAVQAAQAAAPGWAELPFDERAAVFLRAADLLAGPWRDTLNAATMLGQGKTVQQAEIDAACELIDFLRFNVAFAAQIHEVQPISSPGVWNRTDYRPLDGFVYAITPFNFTAIAANLPTAPALMGNTVVWKPSPTQQLAASLTMDLLTAAGLPAGVINLLPGDGLAVSDVVLPHRELAGLHFTGSAATFQHLWQEIGRNISGYAAYPRIVGETGGKDFIVVHPSADPAVARTAMIRGAFEYSGQKCSAASRAYVARSVWDQIRGELVEITDGLAVGDVRDLSAFTSAVIDQRAWTKHRDAIERARADATCEIVAGGTVDDSVGWFVRPTIIVSDDPGNEVFNTEYFGPILGVLVYDDADFDRVLEVVDSGAPYGLTGAVIADDRDAVLRASRALRHAAGNFYVNDKPTGAVVGQQPFGGSRTSGTNDKAGSMWNLIRWTSPRSIKETLVPPTSVGYPHMGPEAS